MQEKMTKIDRLEEMLLIKALIETNNIEKLKEVVEEVIAEAKKKGSEN